MTNLMVKLMAIYKKLKKINFSNLINLTNYPNQQAIGLYLNYFLVETFLIDL